MKVCALWEEEDNENNGWYHAALCFLLVILLALIAFSSIFSVAYVDGESMSDTLTNGECVLIYNNKDVKRGEIIVLSASIAGEKPKTLIKRAVALEGQSIAFVADKSQSQDERTVALYFFEGDCLVRFDEPYIKEPMREFGDKGMEMFVGDFSLNLLEGMGLPEVIDAQTIAGQSIVVTTIPKGHIFFMGDNRNDSSDSRNTYGSVPKNTIIGRMKISLEWMSFLKKNI